ncbi:MAG TPA: type I-C CRISPR-associated protein Cas5c [Fibrobacteria bacterium]|nr:type I-C CRISPR-associated protein Cas5c [Fibrobacteria bacterium]HOX51203.1 type I-C CRISPR-associated protein Cas5c [Fibrobacteria bacterium]
MNEYTSKSFCLEVRGDFACFTRPEMKVERVSYDVITPSAARAVFEAIFWKPAIRWQVRKIEVLNPIRWTSVRRNEVASVASDRSGSSILIEDARQQRAGLFLRDVAYRLHAELVFIPPPQRVKVVRPVSDALLDPQERPDWAKDENPGKYQGMFERRARKGQCFNQPYLGCREFCCEFRLVEQAETLQPAIEETRDLGFMLYDLDFAKPEDPQPMFFRARMENGVIEVPDRDSGEVLR